MTPSELRARRWAGCACALAQLCATSAGMLPWWALPITLALTAAVSRPPGELTLTTSRITRSAGVACVAAFAVLIALKSVAAGGIGADPTATLRSLTEALVVLSLIMAPSARTPREHRVWLTVTTGVMVAAAAGGRTPASAALNLATWIVLLSAIIRVESTAKYADGAVAAVPVGDPPTRSLLPSLLRSQTVVPVLAALFAGAVVFYALPSGLGGGGLAKKIATGVSGSSTATATTRDEVGVDTFGSGDLSLLIRGQLPTTPLLRVPLHSPQLWRGTIYREYTGTSWTDGIEGSFAASDGPSAKVAPSQDDPLPAGRDETDAVTLLDGGRINLIWAPGVITHVSGPPNELRRVIRTGDNVRASGAPLTSYTVTSRVATTSTATLEQATGADPADSIWTQLPPELPAEVAQLARQITASATNRYQQVTDLEAYLRTYETYSQSSPVPSPGDDAVADFLFRDHVGFCEQFASAEAVMLRTLGVPARVVSGVAYGVRSGSTRLITDADAHAWVEVYYPGVGWSPTDPTAGVQLAPVTATHRSAISRALRAVAAAVPGGTLVVGVLAALLIVALAWLVNAWRGPWPARRRRGPRTRRAGPVLAAFLRMSRRLRALPPRASAETPREYLERVAARAPEQIDAALAALEQELYGETPPDAGAVAAAVAAFGQVDSGRD